MWPWQQPSVRKRYAVFAQFGFIVSCVHALFLFGLFFAYHHGTRDIMLTIRQAGAGAPVKFVSVLDPKKQSTVRETLRHAQGERAKKSKLKPALKKPPVKQVKPKTVLKKKVSSPSVRPEPVEGSPERIKKASQKAVRVAPKKQLPKVVQQEPVLDTQEFVVSHGSWGNVAQKQVAALYEELSSQWRPPAGIAKECACTMKVAIGWDQKVCNVETIKASGVLMYDVSVRSALKDVALPLWTRGKTLTITFRQ